MEAYEEDEYEYEDKYEGLNEEGRDGDEDEYEEDGDEEVNEEGLDEDDKNEGEADDVLIVRAFLNVCNVLYFYAS